MEKVLNSENKTLDNIREPMIIQRENLKVEFIRRDDFAVLDSLLKLLKQDQVIFMLLIVGCFVVLLGLSCYLAFLTSVHSIIVLVIAVLEVICILLLQIVYSKYSSISSKSFSKCQYGKVCSVYNTNKKDKKFVNIYKFPRMVDVEFNSYMESGSKKIVYDRVLFKGVYCSSPNMIVGDRVMVFHMKNGKCYGMKAKSSFS